MEFYAHHIAAGNNKVFAVSVKVDTAGGGKGAQDCPLQFACKAVDLSRVSVGVYMVEICAQNAFL